MWRWSGLIVVSFLACGDVVVTPGEEDAGDAGPWICSPLTCAGCCSNNICRDGNEQLACGYDGRACRECGSSTTCVSPGTCVANQNDAGALRPYNPDAGMLTNPFTGGPLEPPTQKCFFIFDHYVCS